MIKGYPSQSLATMWWGRVKLMKTVKWEHLHKMVNYCMPFLAWRKNKMQTFINVVTAKNLSNWWKRWKTLWTYQNAHSCKYHVKLKGSMWSRTCVFLFEPHVNAQSRWPWTLGNSINSKVAMQRSRSSVQNITNHDIRLARKIEGQYSQSVLPVAVSHLATMAMISEQSKYIFRGLPVPLLIFSNSGVPTSYCTSYRCIQ